MDGVRGDGMGAVRMMRMKEGPSADSHARKVSVLLDLTKPLGVPQGPSWFPRLFIPMETPAGSTMSLSVSQAVHPLGDPQDSPALTPSARPPYLKAGRRLS